MKAKETNTQTAWKSSEWHPIIFPIVQEVSHQGPDYSRQGSGGWVGWIQEDVGVIRVHFRSSLAQAGEWERSESEPAVISTFLTDPWKNYGVLSQDHRCKALHQDQEEEPRTMVTSETDWAPLPETPPIITSRLFAPNLDKNAYLSAHPLVS